MTFQILKFYQLHLVKFPVIILYFGDELDDNGPNTVNDATVTVNANIPNWTTNFTDKKIEPFTQDSGPCLPESFDVSVAMALDYFNLLFKPEIFSDI